MKYRKYLLSPVLLVVAALAIASLGRTEEASRYSGSVWTTLDLKQVQAAAAEIKPDEAARLRRSHRRSKSDVRRP